MNTLNILDDPIRTPQEYANDILRQLGLFKQKSLSRSKSSKHKKNAHHIITERNSQSTHTNVGELNTCIPPQQRHLHREDNVYNVTHTSPSSRSNNRLTEDEAHVFNDTAYSQTTHVTPTNVHHHVVHSIDLDEDHVDPDKYLNVDGIFQECMKVQVSINNFVSNHYKIFEKYNIENKIMEMTATSRENQTSFDHFYDSSVFTADVQNTLV